MRIASSVLFAAAAALLGCSDYDELEIECEGQCDGLSSVRSLIGDIKKLDLQDLINVGASYATESLDARLGSENYAGIQLAPTNLFTTREIAANDLTLGDLDRVSSSLAARLGESSLASEVNRIRADHLHTTGKRVYAEAAFRINAGLGHNWTLATGGFGSEATGAVTLGFAADASLEARVITAHRSESGALIAGPLGAIRAARGFILPRSLDDVRKMEPGESFALSGRGKLGINLGAGVPILIAHPTAFLTYSLVLSAGMRSVFDGQLDVQLIRMRDDQVVIDVGVQTSKLTEASIALRDGFGVQGLLAKQVEIAGKDVDLGRLLDNALRSRVTSKLSLIQASASRTSTAMRMSLARLRFNLDKEDATGGREQALAQALRGDVRLAQVLAARGDAGVIADFDLVRSGASAISHAGLELVGMKFYSDIARGEGDAVIQTPGGVLSLMWQSLHRESGWFFSSHGYTRIGVAGLRFDARTPNAQKGETNLFVQTEEGDKFMERDKVIDQLDSLIVAVGGRGALEAIERQGNQLERLILARCPLPEQGGFFDESCNINLINGDSEVAALRSGALAELDAAISALPDDVRELVHQAGVLRLAAQSIEDPNAALVGPTASFVANYRLDDAALRELFNRDRNAFESMVLSLMEATQLNRLASQPASERDAIRSRSAATARAMGDIFDRHRGEYARLLSIEGARLAHVGEIGANTVEVRYPVDANNRPQYEQAISRSVAQARAATATSLFDQLRDKAKSMPSSGGSRAAHPEQIASYTLLGLSPVSHSELRLDFRTDNSSCAVCPQRRRYDAAGFVTSDRFVTGSAAAPIGAGLFDIDAIIAAPQ